MVRHRHLYILNYYDEEGREQIIEVPAYSASQAEMLSGKGNVISVEESIRKDYRMRECHED